MPTTTHPPAVRRVAPPPGRCARPARPRLRLTLVLTVLLGLAYPLVVTGIAQVVVPGRADGSLVSRDGRVVGSSLIARPTRPGVLPGPAVGRRREGLRPAGVRASNLGLDNPDLVKLVANAGPRWRRPTGLAVAGAGRRRAGQRVGLDPQISPEYAAIQVARVARERTSRRPSCVGWSPSTRRAAPGASWANRASTCSR